MQHFFTRAIFLALFTGICQFLAAQQMTGLSNSNYAGIHGVLVNPSQVADTRYGFYLNLGGIHFTANSSFIDRVGTEGPSYPLRLPFSSELYEASGRNGTFSPGQEVHAYSEILGPSLLIKLSEYNGFALFTRYRGLVRGENVPAAFADFYRGTPQVEGGSIESMQLNANSFTEMGISFGQTLLQRGSHFVKAGLTYKRLTGVYGAYMRLQQADYSIFSQNQSESMRLQLSAENYELGYTALNPLELSLSTLFSPAGAAGSGHAFDVGLSYEWRPKVAQYEYFMDGKIRLDNTRNKYKIRAAFALLDMGNIRYRSEGVRSLRGGVQNLIVEEEDFYSIGDQPAAAMEGLLSNGKEDVDALSFTSHLPRRLNMQLDYHVAKSFYLNMMMEKSMAIEGAGNMRVPGVLAFTPRFEADGAEFAVPVSLVEGYKQPGVGVAFKVGFLELGVSNLPALLSKKNEGFSNIYLGLRIFNVRKKRKDTDNDGVSDRYDLCPEVQGVWEFAGCPDSDLDGVEDRFDECPEASGAADFNGCPDTDEDGIRDKSDLCPYEKGNPAYYGCPDSDGDGLADYEDDCPALAGLAGYFGCPDTDKDGMPDSEDACPRVAGLPEFKGCPDTDGDGLPDTEDECPTVSGSYRLNGCIDTDEDGVPDHKDACPEERGTEQAGGCVDSDLDGVADREDRCPEIPGDASAKGCPVFHSGYEEVQLSGEELQRLEEAEQLLEFDSEGRLTVVSEERLKEVAAMLQEKPEQKLLVMYFSSFGGEPAAVDDGWGSTTALAAEKQPQAETHALNLQEFLIGQGLFADQIRMEQKWMEDIPEQVEWNEDSGIMLRIIK